MNKYLIVDLANCFSRARHAAARQLDIETKVAFAMHVTLSSIAKCWREQKGTHVVVALEGRSWRKDFYPPYKRNRTEARNAASEKDQEEDRLFWEGLNSVIDFLVNKTNCTTLRHPKLEADDLIGGWVQSHPNDNHVIISTDTDYYQLLSATVSQYNGVTDELHTINGILDKKGKYVIDKKTNLPKTIPDPSWILFEKCMRGDSTDNVFSAFPGVRTKGSKNKVGLLEAYEDREKKGFAWNNLMLQRFVDHEGVEHRVLDDYQRNVTLIDLSAQPDHIREYIAQTIADNSKPKNVSQIGVLFMKFCGKHNLVRMSDLAPSYVPFLSSSYPG